MAEQSVPLPPKRTKFITVAENQWKTALVDSFKGFSANQVSQEHVDKATACMRQGGTRDERYRLVPFERILYDNQQHGKPNYLTSMTSAYDLLLKFVINLLKPNRPAVWRSIKTDNTSFKARVACMKGYDDILRTAGYTEKGENLLQFPDSVTEPNKDKLYVIAAELLMARLEVDQMNAATQQRPRAVEGSPPLSGAQATRREVDSSPRGKRAQTTFIGESNAARSSQLGQSQRNNFQGHRDQPDDRFPQQHASTDHTAGEARQEYGRQRVDHTNNPPSPPRHDPSEMVDYSRPLGQQQVPRGQSDERAAMTSNNRSKIDGSFTVNLGSPAEVAQQNQSKRPIPKPRVRSGRSTPDRSSSQQSLGSSQQSSLPSPSSSTSSLYSPTTPSDSDESSLPGGAQRKVAFCDHNLSAISEGSAAEEGTEDAYIKSLRERRLAAKHGDKKNITVAAPSAVQHTAGNGFEQRRSYTTAHPIRHEVEPQRHTPSLSEFRQSPPPPRTRQPIQTTPPSGRREDHITKAEDQATPTRWSNEQATPTRWSNEQATPIGRGEGDVSDDSSSEKFSTPPTTISPEINEQEMTSSTTPTPEGTKRSTSVASDTSEHDVVLNTLRERRRKLKEERERSSEKKNLDISSPPPTATTETKTEKFPDSNPPTRSNLGAGSEVNSQVYREHTDNPSLLSTLPSSTGIYCTGCNCKVRLGQKYCDYCNRPVYPYHPPSSGTPSGSVPTKPANVVPTEGGGGVSGPRRPLEPRPQLNRDPYYQPDPDAPALPPKPAPRKKDNSLFDEYGYPKRAVDPESVPSQRPPPMEPLRAWGEDDDTRMADDRKHHDRFSQRPGGARSEAGPSGMPYPQRGENEPRRGRDSRADVPVAEPSPTGASGVSRSLSGIEQIQHKLDMFRDHLRKKGLTDEQIDSDPEYVEMKSAEMLKYRQEHGGEPNLDDHRPSEQRQPSPEKKKAVAAPAGRRVDVRKYDKVNLMETSYSSVGMKNVRVMEQLKDDGENLLTWIKRCVPFGYSLDEIQIASDFVREGQRTKSRNPLQFLDSDWALMTRRVQDWVSGTQFKSRPFVGKPTEDETRKALVETSGNVESAVDIIYKNRKNKIEALIKRFADMKRVCANIKDLVWENAVDVLSVNEMDVDKACYAVQCEWLQPVYESINSEHKKVKQEEMEELKNLLLSHKDDKEIFSKEARCRMLMAECNFVDCCRAEIVVDLMREFETEQDKYPFINYVDAARDFDNLESARGFLFKECPLCMVNFTVHDMITMPACECSFCKNCFKENFHIVIKEKQVKHFNCPVCRKPDMSNRDIPDAYGMIFVSMIKEHLNKDDYELCQEKMKDFNLTKEPGFLWCANEKCGSGFIYDGNRDRVSCPHCKMTMCIQCKRPWEDQHEGITCEKFAEWKQLNDPDAQQLGLAAHLNANGIECPVCHARYELARGGCMHFKCTRCPNEFCSGCGASFKQGQECGKFEACAGRGLHAHHPRDCLFFLRDFDVEELQQFLQEKNVEFDTEPPKEQVEAAKREKQKQREEEAVAANDEEGERDKGEEDQAAPAAEGDRDGEVELHCRVEEQKELVDGLEDDVCGREVKKGHAGLCELHYKEYLVHKINKNGLDPITIYSTRKIQLMLERDDMEVLEQDDDDTDDQYREKLIKHVQGVLVLAGVQKEQEQGDGQAVAVVDIEEEENGIDED